MAMYAVSGGPYVSICPSSDPEPSSPLLQSRPQPTYLEPLQSIQSADTRVLSKKEAKKRKKLQVQTPTPVSQLGDQSFHYDASQLQTTQLEEQVTTTTIVVSSIPEVVEVMESKLESMTQVLKRLEEFKDFFYKESLSYLEYVVTKNTTAVNEYHDTKKQITALMAEFHTKMQDISHYATANSAAISDTERGIFINRLISLRDQFKCIFAQLNKIEVITREKLDRALIHQIKITDPEADVSVLENVKDEKMMKHALQQLHLKDSQIKELQKRVKDLAKVEEEMAELEQIMIILAEYIHDQGEWIEEIEHGVHAKILPSVQSGKNQLVIARKLKSKQRKKKFFLFAAFTGALAALGTWLFTIFR